MNNDTMPNLIDLLYQNNPLYSNDFLLMDNMNQISFLKNKRFLENQNFNNNDIFLQENNNFNFFDFHLNELPGYYNSNLGFCSQSIRSSFIYDNNSNLNEVELNNYSLINFDPIEKGNKIENYFINNI